MSKQEKKFIKIGENYVYLTEKQKDDFINFLTNGNRPKTYDEYRKENKINLFYEDNSILPNNVSFNCWRQKNNHNYFVSKYRDASHLEAIKELEKFVDYMENIKMSIT